DLPRVEAAVGNDGLSIGSVLRDTQSVTYDPGFMNTANAQSAITYIDGDAGILRYRGYPIEDLAKNSSFLEVAYLLIYGELPRSDLPRVEAAVGNDGLSIGSVLRDTQSVTYDPGFMNTANAQSAITYIDGDAGILRYRGYPIEDLAKNSSFLEVAYLLIYGELP